ncbi:hypothetical protein [Fluviispira multicolorata]|uniref:Uncharacterized protein n=1 Tax=Fluviispira multicolorata TaxID=2654512 RepID=A0A833JF18_9BACT|nr:hypothetical protein [Fluviispira multicolorata]KAB8030749.1 hypothetical protein GCL57_07185 [Fluviispira multicolorata]
MHTLLNTIKNLNQSSNLGSSANTTKSIAESIFKDLRSYGLADKDIVAISSELLNKLTDDLKSRNEKNNIPS